RLLLFVQVQLTGRHHLDGGPRMHLSQTDGDDTISRLQTLVDDTAMFNRRPQLHRHRFGLVVVRHNINHGRLTTVRYGLVGDNDRVVARFQPDTHTHEPARHEPPLGIVEYGPQPHGTGIRIDRALREIDHARLR